MIFKPALARQIIAGRKTATRRPIKTGETHCRYRPGHTYALQSGRGKPAIARLHIDHVTSDLLGNLTFADARAEGFKTTADFQAYWLRLHDPAWVKRTAADDDELDPDQVAQRFTARHAHRAVWVITFHLDADEPRLLAARPIPDYTANPALAARDEPEAVSDSDLERLVADRRRAESERRADEVLAARDRMARELETLELLDDKRIHDRARLIRRNLQAIDRIIKTDAA